MTTFSRPERLEFNVYLTKQSKAVRVGITFESDEDAAAAGRQARPWVKSLHPYGLASTNGLQVGDEIVNINGQRITTPLAAASMLRELSGDIRIGVRRPHPKRERQRQAAGAAGSSSQGAASMPKLSLGAVTAQQPEERDIGELSARAIKGVADFFSSIGDDISRMLQPRVRRRRGTYDPRPPMRARREPVMLALLTPCVPATSLPQQHAAASMIAANWRGYRSRLLLARWRWAATELERLRRGTVVRQVALRQHQAAIVIQSHARGHVDRLWVQVAAPPPFASAPGPARPRAMPRPHALTPTGRRCCARADAASAAGGEGRDDPCAGSRGGGACVDARPPTRRRCEADRKGAFPSRHATPPPSPNPPLRAPHFLSPRPPHPPRLPCPRRLFPSAHLTPSLLPSPPSLRLTQAKRAFSFQRKRKQGGRQIDADAPDPPPRFVPPDGSGTP